MLNVPAFWSNRRTKLVKLTLVRRNHRRQNVVSRVETIRSIIPRFTTEELELTSRLADVVILLCHFPLGLKMTSLAKTGRGSRKL